MSDFLIPLPGRHGDVVVSGPFPLSQEDWQHVQRVLRAMEPGLVRPPIQLELDESPDDHAATADDTQLREHTGGAR